MLDRAAVSLANAVVALPLRANLGTLDEVAAECRFGRKQKRTHGRVRDRSRRKGVTRAQPLPEYFRRNAEAPAGRPLRVPGSEQDRTFRREARLSLGVAKTFGLPLGRGAPCWPAPHARLGVGVPRRLIARGVGGRGPRPTCRRHSRDRT